MDKFKRLNDVRQIVMTVRSPAWYNRKVQEIKYAASKGDAEEHKEKLEELRAYVRSITKMPKLCKFKEVYVGFNGTWLNNQKDLPEIMKDIRGLMGNMKLSAKFTPKEYKSDRNKLISACHDAGVDINGIGVQGSFADEIATVLRTYTEERPKNLLNNMDEDDAEWPKTDTKALSQAQLHIYNNEFNNWKDRLSAENQEALGDGTGFLLQKATNLAEAMQLYVKEFNNDISDKKFDEAKCTLIAILDFYNDQDPKALAKARKIAKVLKLPSSYKTDIQNMFAILRQSLSNNDGTQYENTRTDLVNYIKDMETKGLKGSGIEELMAENDNKYLFDHSFNEIKNANGSKNDIVEEQPKEEEPKEEQPKEGPKEEPKEEKKENKNKSNEEENPVNTNIIRVDSVEQATRNVEKYYESQIPDKELPTVKQLRTLLKAQKSKVPMNNDNDRSLYIERKYNNFASTMKKAETEFNEKGYEGVKAFNQDKMDTFKKTAAEYFEHTGTKSDDNKKLYKKYLIFLERYSDKKRRDKIVEEIDENVGLAKLGDMKAEYEKKRKMLPEELQEKYNVVPALEMTKNWVDKMLAYERWMKMLNEEPALKNK